MVKALYMWLVLEAFDKCCEERILGEKQFSSTTESVNQAGTSIKRSIAAHSTERVKAVASIDLNESKT